MKIVPPESLTPPPAGVRLSAATDASWTRLPGPRQEDLRKSVVQPLCSWLQRFSAEELCYTSGNKAVFNSQVHSELQLCGAGQRAPAFLVEALANPAMRPGF